MLRLILLSLMLTACSSSQPSECSFDLIGWSKVQKLPDSIKSVNKNNIANWYVNEEGDYFYCKEFGSSNVCGQEFEIHYKNQTGGYSADDVICMQ